MSSPDLLGVKDLSVVYRTDRVDLPVLRDIHLNIQKGQVYGLVGESGSGKTTLGLAIMRYLPPEARVIKGAICLENRDLLRLETNALRPLWGKDLTLVPQNPYASLNPSIRIGKQMMEVFRVKGIQRQASNQLALEWIERVRLPEPAQIARKYPHELSGGQIQRILVAMALSNRPKLLVLDEPTTSLDVTTEAAVLDLLRELIQEVGTAVLFITHNLNVVANLADRVAVLYAGELVEDASTRSLYQLPLHPYSQGLLNSIPGLGLHKEDNPIQGIGGQIPSLSDLPKGCIFSPRCEFAVQRCFHERPNLDFPQNDRSVRCHRWHEINAVKVSRPRETARMIHRKSEPGETILKVKDLAVDYKVRGSSAAWLPGKKKRLQAVDGVSFQLARSRTLGIVGESGSGKTSLALAMMGLIDSTSGEVTLFNLRLPHDVRKRGKKVLRQLQMVFQNQEETFSPYLTVKDILSRPLLNLSRMKQDAVQQRVLELLAWVRLPAEYAGRFPRQLSGGEKQRVAIALAFAVHPELLIADEPVSALDVSVQANILNLLQKLQREQNTAGIIISHDIAVVTYLADNIAVMYLGQVMQISDARDLLYPPYHPYTEALLSAVPVIGTDHQPARIHLDGDIPDPLEKPSGCPFHSRCPRMLGDICRNETPPWQQDSNGKQVCCHIPLDQLSADQKSNYSSSRKEAGPC